MRGSEEGYCGNAAEAGFVEADGEEDCRCEEEGYCEGLGVSEGVYYVFFVGRRR